MNKRLYRPISTLVAIFIVLTLAAGCQRSEKKEKDVGTETTQTDSIDTEWPIKDKSVTLTYWCSLNSTVSKSRQNLGETELYKELEKRTGVKVQFIHPPATGVADNFNLMMASGDLPDIIEYNWLNSYSGGPEKAIQDGNIIKLNDLFDKYAVILKEYLNSNKDIDKMVKTDSGSYYVFPFLRGDKWLCT